MIVIFEQAYLKELYERGRCSDKKHRFQPQIIKTYQRRIEQLQAVQSYEVLYQFNALNFEALKGDKLGLYSIRVNNQYRIEFALDINSDVPSLTICNIVELSNHYK
ncbi:MAG: type II toxin-antitoxin system RelE/ParE family toxin [Muribaculaceae bacterium]|nr:type II toxin-antitoxin system RelE/ParE family toxin [Muribaculaceae bacterium]